MKKWKCLVCDAVWICEDRFYVSILQMAQNTKRKNEDLSNQESVEITTKQNKYLADYLDINHKNLENIYLGVETIQKVQDQNHDRLITEIQALQSNQAQCPNPEHNDYQIVSGVLALLLAICVIGIFTTNVLMKR